MEADGAETPEGKGERVCREEKKGKREEWGGCGGEEVLRPIPAMLRMAAGEEMRKGTGKGGEVLGGLSWSMAVECKATAEGFERSAEVSSQ